MSKTPNKGGNENKQNKTHGPSFKSDFIIYKEMHGDAKCLMNKNQKMNKWGREETLIRKGRFQWQLEFVFPEKGEANLDAPETKLQSFSEVEAAVEEVVTSMQLKPYLVINISVMGEKVSFHTEVSLYYLEPVCFDLCLLFDSFTSVKRLISSLAFTSHRSLRAVFENEKNKMHSSLKWENWSGEGSY